MGRADASPPAYAARTTPLRPETVWTVDNGDLVEVCGARRKAFALSALREVRVVGQAGTGRRAAHLTFSSARVIIPAQSLSPSLALDDRSAAFDAFVAELGADAPTQGGRPGRVPPLGDALVWGIGLTAAGALFMIVAALVSGMAALGLALGARLLFVPILLCAALPWLGRNRASR